MIEQGKTRHAETWDFALGDVWYFRPNEAHFVQGLAPDGCKYIAGVQSLPCCTNLGGARLPAGSAAGIRQSLFLSLVEGLLHVPSSSPRCRPLGFVKACVRGWRRSLAVRFQVLAQSDYNW